MRTISVGQAIVDVFKAEGVKFIFGMPGGHTIGVYDALYHTPEIQHILVRHEQHAASMAAGYAQLTGEPGICCVTAGPGATNLVTGIAEAYVGALPIVIIAGRGPTRNAHRGASQEIDQVQIFRPLTKWAVRVDRPDLIVEVLRQAFTIARSGKPGPVLIDVPIDIGASQVEVGDYLPVGRPPKSRGDTELINRAAEALARAQRPLIVAGGGAIAAGAADEVRALAERLAIPVITTLSGRGILSDDHPLAAGGLGHHRQAITKALLPAADVVLGLGCRFEQQETNWKPDYLPGTGATYIQVDSDPVELGRSVVPSIGILGDARLVLMDLLRAIGPQQAGNRFTDHPRVRRLAEDQAALEAQVEEMAASTQRPLHPIRVIRAIRAAFPREATVSIDVGVLAQGMGGAYPYFKIFAPRTTIVPSSFYGMGFTAAALPVAKLARPDQPAVGLVGDGSFGLIMNVLPTAVEFKMPVTWCILNDSALGSIWDIQRQAYNGRYLGTEFGFQPDFATIARACGCYGEKVEAPEEIDAALQRAQQANRQGQPAVLDFIVAKERLEASAEFFKR
ncbi:MAG TPA: thiamine pyrophosphate-binding protein [Stellaceae bacterium]|nr:thiamine pyrophosphate-binding protein [Stellaceae bacterium]